MKWLVYWIDLKRIDTGVAWFETIEDLDDKFPIRVDAKQKLIDLEHPGDSMEVTAEDGVELFIVRQEAGNRQIRMGRRMLDEPR